MEIPLELHLLVVVVVVELLLVMPMSLLHELPKVEHCLPFQDLHDDVCMCVCRYIYVCCCIVGCLNVKQTIEEALWAEGEGSFDFV